VNEEKPPNCILKENDEPPSHEKSIEACLCKPASDRVYDWTYCSLFSWIRKIFTLRNIPDPECCFRLHNGIPLLDFVRVK